jgi:hypothetical protein
MSDIHARYLSSSEYPVWDRFAANSPSATVFDETRWLQPICDIFSCELKILGVFKGQSLQGGITFTTKKRFGKTLAIRIPLCPTNSCIISKSLSSFTAKETSHTLTVTETIARFLSANFAFAVVTNNPYLADIRSFVWDGWMTSVQYTYQLDISSIALAKLPPTRRSRIVNAKSNVSVRQIDTPDTAYRLLQKTYTRKDVPVPLTREQLSAIYARLGSEKIALMCAYLNDGTPAAASISLTDEQSGNAYTLLSGFDPAFRDTNAATLLKWELIELLKSRGFRMLDFVGAENKTIALYKSEFGGQLVPYYQVWHSSPSYRILNLMARLSPFKKR